jgi:hypothetical protein
MQFTISIEQDMRLVSMGFPLGCAHTSPHLCLLHWDANNLVICLLKLDIAHGCNFASCTNKESTCSPKMCQAIYIYIYGKKLVPPLVVPHLLRIEASQMIGHIHTPHK